MCDVLNIRSLQCVEIKEVKTVKITKKVFSVQIEWNINLVKNLVKNISVLYNGILSFKIYDFNGEK